MLLFKFGIRPQFFFSCKRFMETLQDKVLLNKNGEKVPVKQILRTKKYILYYFSASWCAPCKGLLPKIKKIYQESCKQKIPLEVIYVSMDTEEDIMFKHFKEKHGTWYIIPFGDDAIKELHLRFSVTHIPYVIVLKNDGTIISRNGKEEIDELGLNVLVTWCD